MGTIRRYISSGINKLSSNRPFTAAVFSFFSALVSRDAAASFYRTEAEKILSLASGVDPSDGRRQVRIPRLPGIDENMRSWSIYMTLQHLVITNEMTIRVIRSLARETPFTEEIDFKKDVMPSENPGPEQIAAFRVSVESFEKKAARFGKKRSETLSRHPVFDMFDTHKWRCMAGFHIHIHRNQVEQICKQLSTPTAFNKKRG